MKRKLWPLLLIPGSPALFCFFLAIQFYRANLFKKIAYMQFVFLIAMGSLFFLFSHIPSLYPQWFYSVFMSIQLFSFITIGQLFIYLFSIRVSLYLIDYYEKNIDKNKLG